MGRQFSLGDAGGKEPQGSGLVEERAAPGRGRLREQRRVARTRRQRKQSNSGRNGREPIPLSEPVTAWVRRGAQG